MRLYSGTSLQFIQDTIHNQIAEKLKTAFFNYYRFIPSPGEVNSWRNSLRSMSQICQYANLMDHGVILEYQLPLSSKRLDCMICGKDEKRRGNAVIVELKQWDKCEVAEGDNEVLTWVGGAKREVLHPSVQVGQYKMYLEDTHTAFNTECNPIELNACTYLHNYNYLETDVLWSHKFKDSIRDYPLFTADDVEKLKAYLLNKLSGGEGLDILNRVEESKYRPNKKLMDHVAGVIKGKPEYILLDEQLIVYDSVLTQARKGFHDKRETVIIIKGGPGTGKSVIAINLMADLLLKGYNTHYATGSRAFTETLRKIIGSRGSAQFKYFNSYTKIEDNTIDVLIADEAHRIRRTSESRFTPRTMRSDIPQIEELLKASKVSVFFIDDRQVVRPNEIGSSDYIKRCSLEKNCSVLEYQLEAQFRCNGSDAFVNWVNNTLGIERTANVIWGGTEEFDFRIYATPIDLEKAILAKFNKGYSARLTAGFCWKWSMPNSDGTLKDDVVIGNYQRPWDAKPEAKRLAPGIPSAALWAYDPNGINQIGCIYTAQGFEFDYVGVIFGEDLVYDFDSQQWTGNREKSADNVVKRSGDRFTDLVKNTYRVLLSRGMKGCYVCFLDKETEKFFKSRMEHPAQFEINTNILMTEPIKVTMPSLKKTEDDGRFINSLPVYSLQAAAGRFLENESIIEEGWINADIGRKLNDKMFVAKVVGDSMEPNIPNGSYCVFNAETAGSRHGKIVLVYHRDIQDTDNGGNYTVKKYWSKKILGADDTWKHEKIVLESLNRAYDPIEITGATDDEFRVIAEFVSVLNPESLKD